MIGILPAAGIGSRLQPLRYPKQLLPLPFYWEPVEDGIAPRLAIEHSLRAMQCAGVDLCAIVVSENKPEILRYLRDGAQFGLQILYLVQPEPFGLAHAVSLGCRIAVQFNSNCCMALPDTVFEPLNALQLINEQLCVSAADLSLGVFPTDTPELLGPVDVTAGGTVQAVFEKPAQTELRNTWGIAAWTPAFSRLLLEEVEASTTEVILGDVFDKACCQGLRVRATLFDRGAFYDLGTHRGLAKLFAVRTD
jgi:glucose-1-phosphate thymidylyltransferase